MCVPSLSQNTAKNHAILIEIFCLLSIVTHLQPNLSLPSSIINLNQHQPLFMSTCILYIILSLLFSMVIATSFFLLCCDRSSLLLFALLIVVVIIVSLSRTIVLILRCVCVCIIIYIFTNSFHYLRL